MDLIKAIIVGIIQGLTEFLPVSSSGHIELGQAILGLNFKEQEDQFSIILHLGTALSTIVVFRTEILELLKGIFQFKWNQSTSFAVKIIISMIPAVIIGILFEDWLETLFSGQVLLVGCMLLITGLLLFLADKATHTDKSVGFLHSIIIGIAQLIAILPGISRSGATIGTSVLLGIDRAKAAKFSFLMVLPLIFGKISKDLISGDFTYSNGSGLPFFVGFLAAFITGIFACRWMIQIVKNSQLKYFAYYCFVVGTIAIIFSLSQ